MTTLNPVFRPNGDQEILHTPEASIAKEGGRVLQVVTKDDLDIRPSLNQSGNDLLTAVRKQQADNLRITAIINGIVGVALILIGATFIGLTISTNKEDKKTIYGMISFASTFVGLVWIIFATSLNVLANQWD